MSQRSATCHPDQKYFAKGLCQSCYKTADYAKRKVQPGFAAAMSARAKRWRKLHEAQTRHKRYLQEVQSRYGLCPKQYNEMLAGQSQLCAICRQPGRTKRRLHIDHDHDTGLVRELLCLHCNAGLGQFKDSIELLQTAAAYLLKHKRVAA